MKKYLIILGLILTCSIQSQVVNTSVYFAPTSAEAPPAGEYCDEYQAVYDAMTTKPSEAHATAQNTFVEAAISHGYWDNFDVFYFFGQDSNSASEALINWKNPGTYNATLHTNPPAFTTLQGFASDGTSADRHVITNYNPYTDGVGYTQNNASFGAYFRVSQSINSAVIWATNDHYAILYPSNGGGDQYAYVNSQSGSSDGEAISTGLHVVARDVVDGYYGYRNGTALGSGSAQTSTGVPDGVFTLMKYLSGGSNYVNNQVSMFFAGSYLTATEVSNFFTDFETLMDALGTGVIP